MIATTKAVQETMVGEGFALGLVTVGVDEFNGSKMGIELASRHALGLAIP